ncbi:MAG TPA: histidine kinase [Candidatus Acidoferrum sp.]|jgi:LytS/YehU family sensor histidine kinase|nr:histidine kinase [Candidatus Acidoferrum sp.]
MHPLLTPINRYGIYLLAWTPLAGILIYLMAVPGKLGWLDAAVLIVPLCLVYQFVCLSAWYTCRATPLRKSSILQLRFTHLAAAVIISFLWVQLARILAYALSQFPSFQGLNERFAPQVPVLFGVGFLLYLLSVASHYVILAIEDSRIAEARAMETSILARDAELKALKAQVNPHFLFNSLNSISALTSADPAKAREMCILLAEFLRTTLGLGEKTSVPLSEELSLLHRYLAIEKVRFGARLRMEEDMQQVSNSVQLPPLLLQPLVENAITHGIANLPDGGTVRLSGQSHNGRVVIAIENTFDPESTSMRKGGLGLRNVRERLEARYGKEANMRVSAENGKFRVDLAFPADTANTEEAKN